MGISGKPEELIHMSAARSPKVQVIKRFSGGGTVVVDQDTVFATLIMQASALPDVECYPRPVMRWSESFYSPVFAPYGPFQLQEHDYVFGERKFGGNAQAITKQRWLHHTSLLWDFQERHMALLKHPSKIPAYRGERSHLEFLCKLRDFMPSRDSLLDSIAGSLQTSGFHTQETSLAEAEQVLSRDHIKSTQVLAS
ncbi:hypothetical protein WJX72_002465 [[Myrmecia] bisecta]|uniref:BPL/LPL catalytic domain-containing protein n=1 Tax=[Myrmecia] bisecta TaxID=41462 RepID=A0AAW1QEH3_9CHLO